VGTEENRKLIEAIFQGVAVGDGSLFRDSLSDDVVMRITGQYSWSQTFRGKADLLTNLYGYLRTILRDGAKTLPDRIIADGEYVVVEARGDMRTKDGERYDNDYCLVYRLQDAKIVEIREYCDSVLCERVLGSYPGKGDLP
jgi:uncharacterized protein